MSSEMRNQIGPLLFMSIANAPTRAAKKMYAMASSSMALKGFTAPDYPSGNGRFVDSEVYYLSFKDGFHGRLLLFAIQDRCRNVFWWRF